MEHPSEEQIVEAIVKAANRAPEHAKKFAPALHAAHLLSEAMLVQCMEVLMDEGYEITDENDAHAVMKDIRDQLAAENKNFAQYIWLFQMWNMAVDFHSATCIPGKIAADLLDEKIDFDTRVPGQEGFDPRPDDPRMN